VDPSEVLNLNRRQARGTRRMHGRRGEPHERRQRNGDGPHRSATDTHGELPFLITEVWVAPTRLSSSGASAVFEPRSIETIIASKEFRPALRSWMRSRMRPASD